MALDHPVESGRQPSRPPERLPLPASTPGAQPFPVSMPFFIRLSQERDAYMRAFENQRTNTRREHIRQIQQARSSRVVVYYSVETLTMRHAELLQDLLAMRPPNENLDLFLLSPGGYADPAYKMVQLCRASCTKRFAILIPYYAKSAATLLCLGADELLMGSASEVGPIDPRIQVRDQYGRLVNISAVSIRDALDLLEGRSKGSPEKALLYGPLLEKVDINLVGEYERALKSSEQFAGKLLTKYMLSKDHAKAAEVAKALSTGYWSHGYPINSVEARDGLGLNAVDAPKDLWQIMWQLHKLYDALVRESGTPTERTAAIFESEDVKFEESISNDDAGKSSAVGAE
jgi:hypothetical protein